VRVFPAGVEGTPEQIEQGREESRTAKRRQMRLMRRQTDRRRRRLKNVYSLLRSYGLLPAAETSKDRGLALDAVDRELSRQYPETSVLPYFLRARALDHRLEPFELGRCLYHLAQRRGFLSNRKVRSRESEEDRGKVKTGISQLQSAMEAAGARTLGEHLSRLDPHQERIRERWTQRAMFEREFEAIWAAQAPHHPGVLTDGRRAELFEAMFHQRPLKPQTELIGKCELEAGEKRAPLWHPLSQRFRLLQAVSDLRLLDPAGLERPLSEEERAKLVAALDVEGDLEWKKIRKLLGLAKTVLFNRQAGGEKRLVGNRTAAKLRGVFQHRWGEMTFEEKEEACADLAGDFSEGQLARKAVERWGLNELLAGEYAELELETGKYLSLSLRAVASLLPRMEAGEPYMTARMAEYPQALSVPIAELLPPVADSLAEIRNPAVVRALTEVRKIINALIRQYGKPEEVHIELARDLKRPRPERERRADRMRQQQDRREEAVNQISAQGGPGEPSRADTEKMLLAMECRFQCPYTGRQFGYKSLESGEVQLEHIVPFSRSLDDSFLNKTLCFVDENKRKGDQTPWEYYGRTGHPEWEHILQRVKQFDSPLAREKLRRFQMQEEQVSRLLSEFSSRQLNDTRYASRQAAKYLAQLYGGLSDKDYGLRIFVSGGEITAYLRRLWSLGGILGQSPGKNREDHRHHAIDATVVAMTGPGWVKALSDAASRARAVGRRRFASLQAPWDGFVSEVGEAISRVVVSHRLDRSVGGAFHEETFYSVRDHRDRPGVASVRKPVTTLTAKQIDAILDPAVRERVRLQVGIVGGDPKKLHGPQNEPTLPTRDGRHIPIRRVRVAVRSEDVRPVGTGERERLVMGGDNHHFEVFAVVGSDGQPKKWDCAIVSKQDAAERLRRMPRQPVVQRDHGPGTRFEFSIAKNDTLEIGPEAQRRLVVVRLLTGAKLVGVVNTEDARPASLKTGNLERYAVNQLMRAHHCRKVLVTPLGEVVPCRD
jgi:CRISPR-associated endonuclease Csn1